MANITGNCIGMGFCMSLDTLCSNAFGARQFKLVGLQTQRVMLILTLMAVPIALVWAQTEAILVWLGLDSIAALSGLYVRILIIGLWPGLVVDALRRFLQAQGLVWPMIAASAIVAVAHTGMVFGLVWHTSLGFEGAALAAALSNWLSLLVLAALIVGRKWVRRRQRRQAHASENLQSTGEA